MEQFSHIQKGRLLLRVELSIDNLVMSSDMKSISVLSPSPFSGFSLAQIMSARI
jgi:hypothetical protein